MRIRILLAEDRTIVREGISALINMQAGFELVAVAENGYAAIDCARTLLPHIVVMAVRMPKMNGIEATRQLMKELPEIKVIALSNLSDKKTVAEMIGAGAKGYLIKDCSFDELVRAINAVLEGRFYLSPLVAGSVIEDYLGYLTGKNGSAFRSLSSRETEVLRSIAEGKTTKQIALSLELSTKTVEVHRRNIMGKLSMQSVADLTKYAIVEGLVPFDTRHTMDQRFP